MQKLYNEMVLRRYKNGEKILNGVENVIKNKHSK